MDDTPTTIVVIEDEVTIATSVARRLQAEVSGGCPGRSCC